MSDATPSAPAPRRRALRGLRAGVTALLLAIVALAVGAELFLQLPPVREAIRRKAEHTLAKKLPGATIARCSAADVTGVVRFDGVALPAGKATATLDGLEVALDLHRLLHDHKAVPARIHADDLHVAVAARGAIHWDASAHEHLPVAVVLGSGGEPTGLVIDGPSTLCREPPPVVADTSMAVAVENSADDLETAAGPQQPVCLSGRTHVEAMLERADDVETVRFQAFGDDMKLGEAPDPAPLPPLAVHGSVVHKKDPDPDKKQTSFEAGLSVGPHGSATATVLSSAGWLTVAVDGGADDFPGFVETLPLPQGDVVRELGVAGPFAAHATMRGPKADPTQWRVKLGIDLKDLRAESAKVHAGTVLRDEGFVYKPAADAAAPAIVMGTGNPSFIPIRKVPVVVVDAVLLSEDSEFWHHKGFDAGGITVALRSDVASGRVQRGGSTITQQLVKNLWLSRQRTFQRKLEEALLTIAVESSLPKERILEIYLNGIEWGPGIYGLQAAAHHYFGVDATELDAKQAIFLASLISKPKRYYGFFAHKKVPDWFDGELNGYLGEMHKANELSDDEYAKAVAEKLVFAGQPGPEPENWND